MKNEVQPVIMKVTFHVQRIFDRESGMQLKVVGRCRPDFAQTAKSRFIHQMQNRASPEGSMN
ncbi:hypothetical protein ACFL2H_05480 [Planctomycetota bacterium]